MRIEIPENVKLIIDLLEKYGKEAYIVGGCVRDMFLSRNPKDWDITTSAKPEEVKQIFYKTVDTGIQHGTVTVMMKGEGYEVTTYRLDGEYTDSRHPKSVTFTSDLSEDLRRRDFTINAMAYNEKTGVVDLFKGIEDLDHHIVRAVGVAEERFTEDALRIMRCVRFASQLHFDIEKNTYEAAKKLAKNLRNISKERIRDEFLKILLSDHPDYLLKFSEMEVLEDFLPGFPVSDPEIFPWIKRLPKESTVRLAALLCKMKEDYSLSATYADTLLKDLRFDNNTKNKVLHLIHSLNEDWGLSEESFRFSLSKIGKTDFNDLYTLRLGRNVESDLNSLNFSKAYFEKIMEENICVSLKELEITGSDLIKLGVKPGKHMGEILQELLNLVLSHPEMNQKELLKEKVLKFL